MSTQRKYRLLVALFYGTLLVAAAADAATKKKAGPGKEAYYRCKDANGQSVAIPTEIQAMVDSADLTESPPVLSIAGKDYTIDKLKQAYAG